MNIDKTKRSCVTCKFFKQYYIEMDLRFTEIERGHCKEKQFKRYDKVMPSQYSCDRWESRKEMVVAKNDSIKEKIKEMNKALKDIANYLELLEKDANNI